LTFNNNSLKTGETQTSHVRGMTFDHDQHYVIFCDFILTSDNTSYPENFDKSRYQVGLELESTAHMLIVYRCDLDTVIPSYYKRKKVKKPK